MLDGISASDCSIGLFSGSSTIWFWICCGTSRSVMRGGVIPVSRPFFMRTMV
jgi:hypothetical protein